MVNPGHKQMSNKQTRAGGRKGRRGGERVLQGGRKASVAAAESLSLLPADLVPVFCHWDPLLLGLVIRLRQHSRKDKQSLHQLNQETLAAHWATLSSRLSVFLYPLSNASHLCVTLSYKKNCMGHWPLQVIWAGVAITLRFKAVLLPNLAWSWPRLVKDIFLSASSCHPWESDERKTMTADQFLWNLKINTVHLSHKTIGKIKWHAPHNHIHLLFLKTSIHVHAIYVVVFYKPLSLPSAGMASPLVGVTMHSFLAELRPLLLRKTGRWTMFLM